MNTLDSIQNFKMYRGKLEDRKLSEGDRLQLVQAAQWAPSGHNSQPWEFLFVDDPELTKKIAEIATSNFDKFLEEDPHLITWVKNFGFWARKSREELEQHRDGIYFMNYAEVDWDEIRNMTDEEAIRKRAVTIFSSNGQPNKFIATAPCLLFTLLNSERAVPDYSRDILELTSAGAAMQNLRLAALEMGIAVHEQSLLYDLPDNRKALGELLGLPEHLRIIGGMRMGYRTKGVRSSFTHVRRPTEEITHHNRYQGLTGTAPYRKTAI